MLHVCQWVCVYKFVNLFVCVGVCGCMRVCVCVCVCTCLCACVCTLVRVCVGIIDVCVRCDGWCFYLCLLKHVGVCSFLCPSVHLSLFEDGKLFFQVGIALH